MKRLGFRQVVLTGAALAGLAVPLAAPVQASPGAVPAVGAAAAEVDVDVPALSWEPCERYEAPAECARVALPLDYDDPTGPTTDVAVVRVPATDPSRRVGSLFVNPGGPGGSSRDFAVYGASELGEEITSRFDVIGVDPRGIGGSGRAACRLSGRTGELFPRQPYPVSPAQVPPQLRFDRAVMADCRADRRAIVDHMSTADTARDMDVVRQALGEEQLSYYGISYGSYLGATYAAMFPDRVRAVVIDGVLDPVAWSTGRGSSEVPVSYRLRSGEGAYESLGAALQECDRVGRGRCSLAGDAYGAWQRVYRASADGRLRVDGYRVVPQNLVGLALGSLYAPAGIRDLVDFLTRAERSLGRPGGGSGRADDGLADAFERLQQQRDRVDAVGPYGVPTGAPSAATGAPAQGFPYDVSFQGVLCSDSANPTDQRAWVRTSDRADRVQPWFGRSWTWASSQCARWPEEGADDAFRGPWRTTTSTPLLVIGNLHDPATPISGARAANRLFADSALLTLDGFAHGALGSGPCVESRMARYLVDQQLPRNGRVCRPAQPLFP